MISHLHLRAGEIEIKGDGLDVDTLVFLFDYACKRYVELHAALGAEPGETDSAPGDRPPGRQDRAIIAPAPREVEPILTGYF